MKAQSVEKNDLATAWANKITSGEEFRKKYSSYSKWGDYRKMYRNQWAKNIVPVNKIFSYGRSMIPKVYFRAPRVSITATHPDLVWHAKVVEAIDNILIRTSLLKGTLKKAILDAFLCGIGPIKLGYDSEFGYTPSQAVGTGGETATQVNVKSGAKIEYQKGIHPGMPWALRVMPDDIVVPWGTRDASNLPWIAHYILRPVEDVHNDQKYEAGARSRIEGTRTYSKDGRRTPYQPSRKYPTDQLLAELWEIRDLKTGNVYVISEEQLLMAQPDNLQINGMPYEFIIFNEDSEYFWPISDALMLEPQQLELNDASTQESRHRAIALLKFLYKKGTIDRTELEKMLSGAVGPAVEVGGDEPLAAAILLLQPHVPPDLRVAMRGILQDMQESLGVGANQTGQFSPYHGKTAAESMIVNESNENRQDERRDVVADVLVSIVTKWNQMIFSFWDEERVTQIVTPEGQPFWIKHTGPELKGNYLLSVDPDSGMPLTRTLKYQMSQDMFKTFNGDQLINQVLLRQMMLDYYSVLDPRASNLLNVQDGVDATAIAAERQPMPMFGGGSGRGGLARNKSGPGASQKEPIELSAFAKSRQEGMAK